MSASWELLNLQRPLGLRELRFELLYALLERRVTGTACSSAATRSAATGCTGRIGAGSCILGSFLRRHQTELSGGGAGIGTARGGSTGAPPRASRQAAYWRRTSVDASRGPRPPVHRRPAGFSYAAAAQLIHILASEGLRVGAVNGHQGLIARLAIGRRICLGRNRGQRIAGYGRCRDHRLTSQAHRRAHCFPCRYFPCRCRGAP